MRGAAFAVAAVGWCAAAAAAQDAGDRRAQETYPLVLLVQGDGTIASAPALPGDPSEGGSLRLRRVRAGADLGAGSFRVRAVLEAQQADGFGDYYAPIDGGRLVGPLRAADSFVSWAPHAAFHADAGVLRVPFSLTRQVGEADLRLPERAAFARALTPDLRAGAGVGGELGALAYAAAVMSAGRFLDGDLFERGALVAARLAAEPIGPVGATPWRRAPDDPWTDWLRFRHGVSFMYGTLFEAKTIGAGTDLSVQWRGVVATGEYVLVHAPSGNQQGAAIEPGLALIARRLDVAARADWQRAAGANGWGAGAALTFYARDPRARLQAGVEHRVSPRPLPDATSALARLTFTID